MGLFLVVLQILLWFIYICELQSSLELQNSEETLSIVGCFHVKVMPLML